MTRIELAWRRQFGRMGGMIFITADNRSDGQCHNVIGKLNVTRYH